MSDIKTDLRRLIKMASRRGHADTHYGRMCLGVVPHYERALAELEAATALWSEGLKGMRSPPRAPKEGT